MSELEKQLALGTVTQGNTGRPFGMKDKIGYMFGDFGNDSFFMLVSSYLMVYYTDIFHINAAVVGVLFLVARLWDAFADFAWGRFIDTRNTTANGKFRPWIFRMSFPVVIAGVLMFVKIPGMPNGFFLVWAFATYILWGTLYSTINIPYGSMASVITQEPVERAGLSTFRSLGGTMAALIINVVAPLIIFVNNQMVASRMFLTALAFGLIAFASYMACYRLSTERIPAEEVEDRSINLLKSLKRVAKNKPLIWILIASLIFMVNTMLVGAINVYLFKDYFGNTEALSLSGLIMIIAIFIAVPLVKPLVTKFGKKEVAATGLAIATVVYFLLFFLKNLSAIEFVGILAIASFTSGFFNLVIWAFVTDVVDYQEHLTNLREDGTVYSIYSMARKVGQAIAGGIGGFALGAVGYNSTLKEQAQGTLNGIYTLSTLVPGIILLIIFLILVFLYPLNKAQTLQLSEDLAKKRNKH